MLPVATHSCVRLRMPKAASNAKQFFEQSKRNALGKLDKSPKGSLDVPIASLVYALNRHPDFVTTSCCSGRVVLFASAPGSGRGGRWLLVRHGTVEVSDVQAALSGKPSFDSPENGGGALAHGGIPEATGRGAMGSGVIEAPAKLAASAATAATAASVAAPQTAEAPGVVSLKVEPAILHVQCRTVDAAKRLLQVALRAGYRESGLVLSESSKVMLAIRTTSNCLEMPMALTACCGGGADNGGDVRRLVHDEYLTFAVNHANEKFDATQQRLATLEAELERMIREDDEGRAAAACGECAEEESGVRREGKRDQRRGRTKGGGGACGGVASSEPLAEDVKRNREQDRVRVPVSELQPLADAPPSAAEVANAAATPDADDESLGGGSSSESLRNTVAAVSRGSTRHYLNLSNGVEAIEGLVHQCGVPPDVLRFCRIQSSHCEQRDFVSVLDSLDPDLLMHLALGYRVRIYDFGSRAKRWPGHGVGRIDAGTSLPEDGQVGERSQQSALFVPSAIWWGVEWIRYALSSLWKLPDAPSRAVLHGHDATALLARTVCGLPQKLARKVRGCAAFAVHSSMLVNHVTHVSLSLSSPPRTLLVIRSSTIVRLSPRMC